MIALRILFCLTLVQIIVIIFKNCAFIIVQNLSTIN